MPRTIPEPAAFGAVTSRDHKGQRGQTLIEVMIALGLLAVLFIALFEAFDSMIFMNRLSSDTTRATIDAERIISDLEETPFSLLRDYTPPALSDLQGQTTAVFVTTESGAAIPGGDPLPPLVRVGVTVSWLDRFGDQQEVALHTLRGDY